MEDENEIDNEENKQVYFKPDKKYQELNILGYTYKYKVTQNKGYCYRCIFRSSVA